MGIENLIKNIVSSIVDEPEQIFITQEETDKGILYQVKVGKDDVGKIIGKQGRVASAIRTVAKAAGAKEGVRVMVNVFNKPVWCKRIMDYISKKKEEQVKKKIFKIYENYGIDIEEITDEEVKRLTEYYSKNLKKLDLDLKKSKFAEDKNE